jgi:hypothetical protein
MFPIPAPARALFGLTTASHLMDRPARLSPCAMVLHLRRRHRACALVENAGCRSRRFLRKWHAAIDCVQKR